jgi:hypothetical protein
MKTKNEKQKFSLEKFEIAKLKNPNLIVGGDGTDVMTTTDTNNLSSRRCVNPQQPPKKDTVINNPPA